MSDESLGREIKRIDESGEAWRETDQVVEVKVSRRLDTVVPVRLSSETWESLRQEARRVGVGPSTLIRMWVLERLGAAAADRRSA